MKVERQPLDTGLTEQEKLARFQAWKDVEKTAWILVCWRDHTPLIGEIHEGLAVMRCPTCGERRPVIPTILSVEPADTVEFIMSGARRQAYREIFWPVVTAGLEKMCMDIGDMSASRLSSEANAPVASATEFSDNVSGVTVSAVVQPGIRLQFVTESGEVVELPLHRQDEPLVLVRNNSSPGVFYIVNTEDAGGLGEVVARWIVKKPESVL